MTEPERSTGDGPLPQGPDLTAFAHDGSDVGVLVVHGFTGSPQGVRPLAQAFADAGFSVRLPVLPGHATTWQDLNTTTWRHWYGEVERAFVELRARTRVVVAAGLSMGGALATRLAELHPDDIAGLVLVNPAFRVDDRRMAALPLLSRLLPSLPGIGNDIHRTDGEPEVRDIAVLRRVNGTWSAPAPLHRDGWAIASCPVNGPQAAALGDTVAVAWFTGARDTARVNVAFSTDAGATFSAPVRADDGLPTGRVDLELLDGGTAVLSWIERLGGDTAQVRTRLVRRDGSVEPALVVSPSSGARSSGFPRMTRDGDGVLVAWTQPGTPSEVKVARLRAGRR